MIFKDERIEILQEDRARLERRIDHIESKIKLMEQFFGIQIAEIRRYEKIQEREKL